MKCKKIQEWLKSDYLDEELNPKEAQFVKEHLKDCASCRKVEEAFKAQAVLFKKINREKVPQHIWSNVRNAIIVENLNKESIVKPGILGQLQELIWGRKPVFALATAFGLILFVTILAGTLIHRNQSLTNTEDIFTEYTLSSENGDFIYGFGTDTEECFL